MPDADASAEQVKRMIFEAFAETPYPGDDALVRSQGDEPDEVVELFRGKNDWRALSAEVVDRAGAASPSALSFFSSGAFRFYLPAFLVADLDDSLVYSEPVFYLFHGLDAATRDEVVVVPGGERTTWGQVQREHLGAFTRGEAAAIVAYLRWRVARGAHRDSVS